MRANELHRYETRNNKNIFIPTGSNSNSVVHQASREYNNVPIEIRTFPKHSFKFELKMALYAKWTFLSSIIHIDENTQHSCDDIAL